MARRLVVTAETWPIQGAFRIARGAKTQAHVIVAAIHDGQTIGRGECVPYARYGESVQSVLGEIVSLRARFGRSHRSAHRARIRPDRLFGHHGSLLRSHG